MEDFADDDLCETCGNDWCTCDDDEDQEMEELQPMETGLVKKQSTIGSSFKFFTMQEFKDKYYEKEIEQYEIFSENRDEMIAICRYFEWNKEKINQKWFEDQDNLRIKIGLAYDTKLVQKYPDINNSLKQNNGGMC